MSRIEHIGRATLHLGDCRELLPHIDPVDAVVTDPPYGIGADKNAHQSGGKNGWAEYENHDWDSERPAPEVFAALRAMSRDQIIWGGNYFADLLPPSMRWLVWDKGQRNFSLADVELAWTNQQKAARIVDFPRAKILSDGRGHPTQKPVELMTWCLDFVPEAKTILDPFMGSGTTGVAAIQAGRTFIGIEREQTYFDLACRRMDACEKQGRLFVEAAA